MPGTGGCRGCAAARSPTWPASAWSTTPSWSGATSAASPTACWKPWPGRCSWTRPSTRICSTSPALPAPRPGPAPRPPAPPPRPRRRPPAQQVRPTIQRLLDLMTEVPAIVNNARLDLVAANTLGQALFAPVYASPGRPGNQPVNHARFTFLDPGARDFWTDWERAADDSVAQLRTEAARDPYNQALTGLGGGISP